MLIERLGFVLMIMGLYVSNNVVARICLLIGGLLFLYGRYFIDGTSGVNT
jgi:hypothetical protein